MKKVLDCTFRDGGYLNGWCWEPELVKATVEIMLSGVSRVYTPDICEIGYRAPVCMFSPEFKKKDKLCLSCEDSLVLDILKEHKDKLCVMVDLKKFLKDTGKINMSLFMRSFEVCSLSAFDYVRIAINYEVLEESLQAVYFLWSIGYKVILSIMKVSTLTADQIAKAIIATNNIPIEILYFADSYGALTEPLIFPESSSRQYGFHGHNNMGCAYANSVNSNADFVDTTLFGLGRGMGNLDYFKYALCNCEAINEDKMRALLGVWVDTGFVKARLFGHYLAFYAASLNLHPNVGIKMSEKTNDIDGLIEALIKIQEMPSNVGAQ